VNISNIEHPKHGLAWVSVHSDITEQKKANEVKAALLHDIGERLKETECMYKISDAIRTKDSLDEIFQDIVSALPPGWHYPDITRGKLRYKEKTWVSEEFEETEWKQSSDIVIAGQILGCVEVYYLEPCPVLDEGPFMMEERKLIDNIGRTISEVIEHQIAQELLKDSEASLRMIYEFAPIMIDAFDKNGRCIMWNKECEKVFGWTAEEMFSQENPLTLFYPDPEIQQRVIESVIHAPDTTPKEWNPLRKDGSETTCLWANYMLPNGSIICLGQDITERKEAEKKVEKYQGRLKSLASQLTLAEEQERRRIAADLHDHIGQSLALTRLQLATARKGLPKNDKRDAQFNEISQALLQAIQDTRNLIFELSSPSLNELGLGAAIKEWVEEQVENKHGLQTEFLDDAQGVELGDDMRAILYRNVRELLTNSIKHADAKTVSVALKGTANQLTITIQDDGKGFDPEETPQNARSPGSFGLFSIQERMADLGGEFEIVSQPGTGSKVTLRVPIEGQTAGGRA
jgi:PAS domain S-box-containing protein